MSPTTPPPALAPPLAEIVVCPGCLGDLERETTPPASAIARLRCAACARVVGTLTRETGGNLLDFLGSAAPKAPGLGPRLMHSRLLARAYQGYWRPLFTTLASGRPHDLDGELGRVDRALAPTRSAPGRAHPVVDLSCGPGHAALHLHRQRAHAGVIAVDWSQAMLAELGATLADQGIADLPRIRADVARLPFARASVAGIHAGAALHLWPDPAAAIAEIGRVLDDDAGVFFSTFARADALAGGLSAALLALGKVRVFYEAELRGLLVAHGIAVEGLHRRGTWIQLWGRRIPRHAPG